ncbi:MAG: hypothetical protein J0G95_14735 [Rhizobiales bacterium]|jgi:hypothetical protein|nr:hypothetical protein [Hyphomicrobiales bacterium]
MTRPKVEHHGFRLLPARALTPCSGDTIAAVAVLFLSASLVVALTALTIRLAATMQMV